MNIEWSPARLLADTTVADNNKGFTSPDNRVVRIRHITVHVVASDTVGNRIPSVTVTDTDSHTVSATPAGAATAASQDRTYQFGPTMSDLTSFRATNYLLTPLPDIVLLPGEVLGVYESANVDPGSDLFEVYVYGDIAPVIL